MAAVVAECDTVETVVEAKRRAAFDPRGLQSEGAVKSHRRHHPHRVRGNPDCSAVPRNAPGADSEAEHRASGRSLQPDDALTEFAEFSYGSAIGEERRATAAEANRYIASADDGIAAGRKAGLRRLHETQVLHERVLPRSQPAGKAGDCAIPNGEPIGVGEHAEHIRGGIGRAGDRVAIQVNHNARHRHRNRPKNGRVLRDGEVLDQPVFPGLFDGVGEFADRCPERRIRSRGTGHKSEERAEDKNGEAV